MDYEVEFRPVGDGSRAGDCIVVRHGKPDEYYVTTIDGGTRDSGAAVVEHLRDLCGPKVIVTNVIVTHADQDHASGVRDIVENLDVRSLWMHVPWVHAAAARPYFKDKDLTDESLAKKLRKEYNILAELWDLAIERKIPICEPFQDTVIGPFRVLTPTEHAYIRLMPQFDRTPDADEDALSREGFLLEKKTTPGILSELLEKMKSWVDERWDTELLKDGGKASASNESSIVLYGDFEAQGTVLLTGDAGPVALRWAADHMEANYLPLRAFELVQIPHHGSRSNVGPKLLDRIVGTRLPADQCKTYAFVSAPKDDETHPRKMVVNAFIRRCRGVYATQGKGVVLPRGFKRQNYSPATALSFYPKVEDYD